MKRGIAFLVVVCLLALACAPALADLKKGNSGAAVTELQQKLIDVGALQGEADGKYGNKTVRAVQELQVYFGQKKTGRAGDDFTRELDLLLQALAGEDPESAEPSAEDGPDVSPETEAGAAVTPEEDAGDAKGAEEGETAETPEEGTGAVEGAEEGETAEAPEEGAEAVEGAEEGETAETPEEGAGAAEGAEEGETAETPEEGETAETPAEQAETAEAPDAETDILTCCVTDDGLEFCSRHEKLEALEGLLERDGRRAPTGVRAKICQRISETARRETLAMYDVREGLAEDAEKQTAGDQKAAYESAYNAYYQEALSFNKNDTRLVWEAMRIWTLDRLIAECGDLYGAEPNPD